MTWLSQNLVAKISTDFSVSDRFRPKFGESQKLLVPDPCRCRWKVGGLAQILQWGPPAWGNRAQGSDLVDQSRWRYQPAIV